MPSKAGKTGLYAIKHHIVLATTFVSEIDLNHFRNDLRTVYAVIRCLEIISEASRRLPDHLKARHANIPWRQIAGAGNIYRHDYEDIAAQIVWDTVKLALPVLEIAIDEEVASLA